MDSAQGKESRMNNVECECLATTEIGSGQDAGGHFSRAPASAPGRLLLRLPHKLSPPRFPARGGRGDIVTRLAPLRCYSGASPRPTRLVASFSASLAGSPRFPARGGRGDIVTRRGRKEKKINKRRTGTWQLWVI